MGTVLRISAFVLAGLVLLAAIVWIGLFHTPAGKSFLRDQVLIYADQFAAERYNSDIAISDLSGDLPGRITLSDVLLRDEEGVWLRVDYLELDWSPWSLIARKIIVQDLIIRNAELSRLPPLPEREEPPAETRSVADYLNMDLPWIEIANVTVESFSTDEGILGEARTFFVNGSLSTANGIVRSDIGLNTAAETDDITSVIALDGETLTVDISVTSSEAGLVTWALNEDEPLSFSLRGEGPVGSWEGVLQFNSRSYGTADIGLLADLTRQNRFQVDGSYSPGAALPQPVQEAAGDGFEFSVLAEKSDSGYNLTTEKFSGYFGLLSGTVGDLPLSMPIEGADFDLILRLSSDYAADRQISLLAGENRLAGSLSYVDDSLQIQGQLDTPVGSVNIAQLQQGPESGLDATLSASVERSPVDQALAREILRDGGRARARIMLRDDVLEWQDLDLATGLASAGAPELQLAGSGRYGLEAQTLQFDGDVTAAPGFVALLTDVVTFRDSIEADFAVSGPIDQLAIDLEATYGDFTYGDEVYSGGRLDAALTDIPSAPQGEVIITSTGSDYAASFNMVSDINGDLLIENISANALGVDITGEIVSNRESGALRADLDVDTRNNATLPGGQPVSGAASLEFRLGPSDAANRRVEAVIVADQLQIGDLSAELLELSASGAMSDISYTVSGAEMNLPGDVYFTTLDTAGTVSVTDPGTEISVLEFRAQTLTEGDAGAIALTRPTRITLRDGGLVLDQTLITFFDSTSLQLAGQFTSDRLVLQAEGDRVRVPYILTPLSFSADIDTSTPEPGRITVTGSATDENEQVHELRLVSIWDEQQLRTTATLTDQSGQQSGRLELINPLRLVRGDSFALDWRQGAVDGQFSYDATLMPLLAFLPFDTDFVNGEIDADVTLSGTVERPDITGGLQLAGGRYEERITGAEVSDVQGTLEFSYTVAGSQGTFQLTGADALGNADRIDLSGRVAFGGQADGAISDVSGQLILDRAVLVDSNELFAEVTSTLDLEGPVSGLLLAGRIDIREVRAVIPSIERRESYVPVTVVRVDAGEEEPAPQPTQDDSLFNLTLDLVIDAKDEIYITGRGLQSEWRGNLEVTGGASSPVVVGAIQSISGRLDFAGRQFDITTGRITFSESAGLNPDLDITAQYATQTDDGEVTAVVEVSGPANNPDIEIGSRPELPQEDVMALILFGKSPSQLTAFESVRIANAVAQLSGSGVFGGGAGFTESLRRTVGVDAFSFGQDAETGANTVSVGKYVSDDIYVSATQGLGAGSSVSVTYDVSNNVSVETTVEQDGTQSVSANYKRDY